jgi:anti-anti-sigma factor
MMQDEREAKSMPAPSDATAIPFEEHEDYTILRPRGYFNALTGGEIDKICESMIQRDIRYFIINFKNISMVNTIGISILCGIVEKALKRDGMVYLTEMGLTDRQVFEVLNLTTLAMIFDNDDEARHHLNRDREAARRATRD